MIPGIVELTSKTIYGFTSRNVPIYRFIPLNTNLGPYLVGCSHKDRTKNILAVAEISETLKANIVRYIGPCGDLPAEKEALLLQYSSINWKKFDRQSVIIPNESRPRLQGFTFNVDPAGCRDIDDVITIGTNGYIYITIANVASWMVQNPDILKRASLLGQTLYENGTIVAPLLPIEEQCSLLPNQERLGISLKFEWTGTEITNVSIENVTVVNNRSYTYEDAETFEYASLLKSIASYLAGTEMNSSHDWIEQLMIFYNCEIAKILVEKQDGLLRYQDEADIEKLNEYKKFGIDQLFLANKSAKYISAKTPHKHWGLQKEYYCHASSPIRRFADIVNQMVICGYTLPILSIEQLNELQQHAKKYERDIFFLSQILETKQRTVQGITLSDHRVWVPNWKRIVTCKNDVRPGTHGTLKYSLDMNQTTWKRRMIFKFADTNCPE